MSDIETIQEVLAKRADDKLAKELGNIFEHLREMIRGCPITIPTDAGRPDLRLCLNLAESAMNRLLLPSRIEAEVSDFVAKVDHMQADLDALRDGLGQ